MVEPDFHKHFRAWTYTDIANEPTEYRDNGHQCIQVCHAGNIAPSRENGQRRRAIADRYNVFVSTHVGGVARFRQMAMGFVR